MKKKLASLAPKINAFKGYEITRDASDKILVALMRKNNCDTHYHKQIELLYINCGKVKVEIAQQSFVMKRGDFIIIHSYCLHKYGKEGSTSINGLNSAICIPLKYTKLFNGIQPPNTAYTLINKSAATRKIFRSLIKLSAFSKANNYKQDSLMYNILGAIVDAQNAITTQKAISGSDIAYKIIEYINEHYAENINLDSLAAYCNYSKNYISTVFNTSFNCNFNEYLNLRRLQSFIEIQSVTANAGIIETAAAVGFNSPRTFFNAFKEHYRMTPKEYLALKK